MAILLGERGRVAGSGLAFALVAGAIAFGVFYVVILAIRESWSRRMLNIGLPLGTKAEQRPPDPQNVAQHEAITRQAKAMETVSSSYREQLHTTTEQLKSQTERADRLESEKKRLVEENAQLRRGPTPGNGD